MSADKPSKIQPVRTTDLVVGESVSPLSERPKDDWDALSAQFASPLTVPPFPLQGGNASTYGDCFQRIPAVPANARFRLAGSTPVGLPIELAPEATVEEANATLAHLWLLLYKRVVQESMLPVVLSGRWGLLTPEQSAFMVWLDAGPTRLVVIPTLRRFGRTISASIAHCVLCHQGWMRAHDPALHSHWADLSANYDLFFHRPGSAYYEFTCEWENGASQWHHGRTWMDKLMTACGAGRWGWGDGEVIFTTSEYPGNPVFFSKELKSFVHFMVGEPAVPEGSEPGVLLAQVKAIIAAATREWQLRSTNQADLHIELPQRGGQAMTFREIE